MNYFKRALTSSWRNLGKTILFFLLIVLLSSVIGASIFVNQAVISTEQNLLNKLPPIATIRADWDEVAEIQNRTGEMPAISLTPEQIRRVAGLPYVKNYDFFSNALIFSETLEPFARTGDAAGSGEWGYTWVVRGVQNPAIRDIQEGNIELVYGRTFTTSEVYHLSTVALISEDVATQNGLVVGSTIPLRNVVLDWDGDGFEGEQIVRADETYNVEIIGIFRPIVTADTVEVLHELDNRIYVPNTFVEMVTRFRLTIWAEMDENFEIDENRINIYNSIFTLYSSHDLPAFREAAVHGIPRQFVVYDAGNPFQDVAAAMETMLSMASFVLYLTIVVSILVLSLLITILLHDRKREIGIYLSVGVKKSHILRQFAMEFISVAIVGISVALFIGEYISQIISRVLIMSEAMAYQPPDILGFGAIDSLTRMEFQVDIAVGGLIEGIGLHPELVLTFLAIGIGTTILSTIAPLIYVLKLDPKKIMM